MRRQLRPCLEVRSPFLARGLRAIATLRRLARYWWRGVEKRRNRGGQLRDVDGRGAAGEDVERRGDEDLAATGAHDGPRVQGVGAGEKSLLDHLVRIFSSLAVMDLGREVFTSTEMLTTSTTAHTLPL